MPKHGFMTPKAVANRQKSKGLQKLRWYCQMCDKQCRDANGFKCHKTSEAHMRNMALYQEDPNKFVREFSEEFEQDFMRLFRHQGGRRVLANAVYRTYIKDKQHFHMNATVWETLTSFCVYLGKEAKAEVDTVEGKLWIKYIDRDPAVIRRQEHVQKVLRLEAKDRMRADERAEEQRKRAMEVELAKPVKPQSAPKALVRDGDETVIFAVKQSKFQKLRSENRKRQRHVFDDPDEIKPTGKKTKVSKMEVLRKELEHDKKANKTKKDNIRTGRNGKTRSEIADYAHEMANAGHLGQSHQEGLSLP